MQINFTFTNNVSILCLSCNIKNYQTSAELTIRNGKSIGVLPLNMGTSRKERMGKQYVNRKWIPTLLDKK
jgi:hypothetical protein